VLGARLCAGYKRVMAVVLKTEELVRDNEGVQPKQFLQAVAEALQAGVGKGGEPVSLVDVKKYVDAVVGDEGRPNKRVQYGGGGVRRPVECWACGKPGHLAHSCPTHELVGGKGVVKGQGLQDGGGAQPRSGGL